MWAMSVLSVLQLLVVSLLGQSDDLISETQEVPLACHPFDPTKIQLTETLT